MLAEEPAQQMVASGQLAPGLHRPRAWLDALMAFIAEQLPLWRDRADRPAADAETHLTSQLCAHLNGAARKTPGWDILQFRTEEPDEVRASRRIDLAPAPSGEAIWIEGRRYGEFDSLFPIECKRLPTPAGAAREKREYLLTLSGSTGGVQRFKAGHHGAAHNSAVMIAYVQRHDIAYWVQRLDRWIRAIARARLDGWTLNDRLILAHHDLHLRLGIVRSEHDRASGLPPITLSHFWVELT